MRTLKMIEHTSLDGVIESGVGEHKYGDWSAPYRTPAGLASLVERLGESFDLLLGRRTYDMFSAFWPKAPSSPIADRLNAATKFVVTHRPESLAWGRSQGLGPDVVESVRSLKAKDGKDIVLWGSSTLTSILLEHELADEILLLVNPVMLGTGKRFFSEETAPRAFALDNSKAFPSGIVANTYKPGGTLQNLR